MMNAIRVATAFALLVTSAFANAFSLNDRLEGTGTIVHVYNTEMYQVVISEDDAADFLNRLRHLYGLHPRRDFYAMDYEYPRAVKMRLSHFNFYDASQRDYDSVTGIAMKERLHIADVSFRCYGIDKSNRNAVPTCQIIQNGRDLLGDLIYYGIVDYIGSQRIHPFNDSIYRERQKNRRPGGFR